MKQTFIVIIFLFRWNHLAESMAETYGECNKYLLNTDQTHFHCSFMDQVQLNSDLKNLIKDVSYEQETNFTILIFRILTEIRFIKFPFFHFIFMTKYKKKN